MDNDNDNHQAKRRIMGSTTVIQASEPCVNGNNDGNDGGGGGHSVHYLVKIWNLKVNNLGRQIRILEAL